MIKRIVYRFAFKDCKESNLNLWQCPSFLFIVMGVINICSMLGVYVIVSKYDIPELVVFTVSTVSILIFSVGSSVIHGFQQVARANRIKSEFVSIASHQLKSPLSGMRWSADILLSSKNERLTDKQSEYIKDMQENTTRMIRLVNDLLDVSRIDDGKMNIKEDLIDLSKDAESVTKSLKTFALSNNTELVLKIGKKLGKVQTESGRIKMVMQNFIDNAIKYSKKSNGKIRISLKNEGEYVMFKVKDNGLGIPKEDQKKIFDKFFIGDNVAKRQTIGTGLGLHIAKAVIESSGGQIGFESREGKGSTFWFSLPISRG